MKIKYRVKEFLGIEIRKHDYGFVVFFNDRDTADPKKYDEVAKKLAEEFKCTPYLGSREQATGLGIRVSAATGCTMVWSSGTPGAHSDNWTYISYDRYMAMVNPRIKRV